MDFRSRIVLVLLNGEMVVRNPGTDKLQTELLSFESGAASPEEWGNAQERLEEIVRNLQINPEYKRRDLSHKRIQGRQAGSQGTRLMALDLPEFVSMSSIDVAEMEIRRQGAAAAGWDMPSLPFPTKEGERIDIRPTLVTWLNKKLNEIPGNHLEAQVAESHGINIVHQGIRRDEVLGNVVQGILRRNTPEADLNWGRVHVLGRACEGWNIPAPASRIVFNLNPWLERAETEQILAWKDGYGLQGVRQYLSAITGRRDTPRKIKAKTHPAPIEGAA